MRERLCVARRFCVCPVNLCASVLDSLAGDVGSAGDADGGVMLATAGVVCVG